MEHLLNLLWLTVVCSLFAAVVRASRAGTLRCSLPAALGATLLLALVLFPALSITDDMQRAKLDTESTCRHLADGFRLGSPADHTVASVALLPFLLLLLLSGSGLLSAEFLARRYDPLRPAGQRSRRPLCPRPPPVSAFA